MSLLNKLKNHSSLKRDTTSRVSSKTKSRSTSGNSADAVLDNELDRMEKYISEDNKKKIVNVQTALKYGVAEIGSTNDPAGILQTELIPVTTKNARLRAAKNLAKKYAPTEKTFYSKNRYFKRVDVSYMRKDGNKVSYSYIAAYDVRKGRVKLSKRIKKKYGM